MEPKKKPEATPMSPTSSSGIPGFDVVNLENLSQKTLTSEDLESGDKELWLIKVPYDFDVSKLSGTKIVLNGGQELPASLGEKENGKRYESQASMYPKDEKCPFKMVVPSKKRECLEIAPQEFSGHIDIIQTVKVPMLVYPPAPPAKYTDVPEGLKARWKPFGHETPRKVKKREDAVREKMSKKRKKEKTRHESPKKKKKRDESDDVSSKQDDDWKPATKEKRKKKKKDS